MPKYQLSIEVDIAEGFGSFQALELKILEAAREAGRNLMGKILSDYESNFIEQKPVQKKDQREKVFETLLGKISLKRWRVKDVFKKKCVYPVDAWMGLSAYQKASPGLVSETIRQCVEKPYGKASKVVELISGVKKTTTATWNLIQGESQRQQAQAIEPENWKEKTLPELKPDSPDGCPILAVDPDATYVRARRKTDKKHEVKAAVLYTARKKKGKNRWELVQKQVVTNVINGTVENLFNKVTEKAVKEYGLHAGSRVVVHGDGDPWIKQYKNDYCPQALNRLDPYHVFKKIRDALDVKEIPETWIKYFYTNPSLLIQQVKELEKQMAEPKDKEKLTQLAGYLENNKEGMEPSGVPKAIKKKFLRMYHRGSGPIESNIFSAVCQRFKAPRMMWSEDGLKNLNFLREKYLNQSSGFTKVNVPPEYYKEMSYADELRDIVRDL